MTMFWLRAVLQIGLILATIAGIVSPLYWQRRRFRRRIEGLTLIRSAEREEERQHETLTDTRDLTGYTRRY